MNEGTPPTPQWRVIEGITTAEVLASAGDHKAASSMLTSAIGYAEELRLSHQAQRITLLAAQLAQAEIAAVGPHAADALSRINAWLAGNDPAVPHLT